MTIPKSMERRTERLEAIRARLDAATWGPWGREDDVNKHLVTHGRDANGAFLYVADVGWTTEADVEFIAHAPSDLRYCLDELAARDRRIEGLERALRDLTRATEKYFDVTQGTEAIMKSAMQLRAAGHHNVADALASACNALRLFANALHQAGKEEG